MTSSHDAPNIVVRFAPSPTGYLHVGNIMSAVFNKLFATKTKGSFYLRFDDTDRQRFDPVFVESIMRDLNWLTLSYDKVFYQSERLPLYQKAFETLKDLNLLYPCYETEEELDLKRKRQRALGRPPIYDRAALELSPQARLDLEAQGRAPHWRLKLDLAPIVFEDLVRGPLRVEPSSLSDPVLVRQNGQFLYTFTSVVDDIELRATHIIRGSDHITNTGVQIQIFKALKAEVPHFAHCPLVVKEDGQPLSKRNSEDMSIAALHKAGFEPKALCLFFAFMGAQDQTFQDPSWSNLARNFAFDTIGHSDVRFSMDDLKRINHLILQSLSFGDVQERLAPLFAGDIQEQKAFWDIICGNISFFDDVFVWQKNFEGHGDEEKRNTLIEGLLLDTHAKRIFFETALASLPTAPLDAQVWHVWVQNLQEKTSLKKRDVIMLLRFALTSQQKGPHMQDVFRFYNKEKLHMLFTAVINKLPDHES